MFEVFGPVSSCKLDEASQAFGFVCFEKPENAKSALDHFSKIEGGLQIAKALPKSERARQLRLQTLRFMKDIARQNLYFKGFPVDGNTSIEDLSKELEAHFSKCGEIKTLKLMSRTIEVEGVEHEELLGFGFVSFTTLEGSQKARFDGSKELFRGTHKL
jgi:RNA recognition motif-containing protein